MRKIAVITKNRRPEQSSWKVVPKSRKFFVFNKFSINDIKKYDPDVVIIHVHDNPNAASKFAAQNYKSIYLYTDFRRPIYRHVKEFSKICDGVCFSHKDPKIYKEIEKDCNQKNIYFVNVGANTDIYYPVVCKKEYDILFSANYLHLTNSDSAKRTEFVEKLKARYKDRFHIIGTGWPKRFNAMPRVRHENLNLIVNKSKVTVGMSSFLDVPYYTSARLFQQMATGVPHIAWHAPNVGELFKNGYMEVKNYDELFILIDKFLKDSVLRAKVGKMQFYEIIQHHTANHFWNNIEDAIGKTFCGK